MRKTTYACFIALHYCLNIKAVNANYINKNNWNKYNSITYHDTGFRIKNYRSSHLHKINKIISKKNTSIKKIEHYLAKHINNHSINSIFMNVAKYHINLENYDKALKYYNNLIVFSDDEKQNIIFDKAYIYLCKKDYKKALELFKTMNNSDDKVKYYMSVTYLFLDQYDDAFKLLETINEDYENINEVKYIIVYSFFQQKKYLELIKYYHKNIQDKYSDINNKIYFLLGISYFQTEDYESSIKYLRLFKDDVNYDAKSDELEFKYDYDSKSNELEIKYDDEKISDFDNSNNNEAKQISTENTESNSEEEDIDISIDEFLEMMRNYKKEEKQEKRKLQEMTHTKNHNNMEGNHENQMEEE